MGGEAAIFGALFFEFWKGRTRFLIIFSEGFAKLSLITARDDTKTLDNVDKRTSLLA